MSKPDGVDNDVPYGQGNFPAAKCDRSDAMLLYKAYHRFGAEVYRDVLSGTTAEVNRVKDEAEKGTHEFTAFKPEHHDGSPELKTAVDAWVAAQETKHG